MLLVGRAACTIALALTTAGSAVECSPGSYAPATTAGVPVPTSAATPQPSNTESPGGSQMEYREAYHGHDFVVTTNRGGSGWTYRVDFAEGDNMSPLTNAGQHYSTSEEARSGALSAAAAAIDRGRTSTGKP